MDNNFENKLRDLIKVNVQIPNDVNSKIQKTYQNLKKPKKELTILKLSYIVASLVIVIFLGGNILAYTQNKENVFSWILQVLNIEKEYNNNSQQINESIESNQTTITVTDIGIDNSLLIIGYHIKTNKELNNVFILNGEKRIIGEDININILYNSIYEQFNNQIITKISNTEYILYEMYDIRNYKLANEFTLVTNITSIDNYKTNGVSEFIYENDNSIQGSWKFNLNILKSNNTLTSTEYAINNFSISLKDGETIELISANISDMVTILTFDEKNYDMARYTIEILDENDNIILERNLQTLSGSISKIITKKLDINEKIKINIYKYDLGTGEILAEETSNFTLSEYVKINTK